MSRGSTQRALVILSDRSSGSSALQRFLAADQDVRLLAWTPHEDNETLYWSKAVAALGRRQARIMESTAVPMSRNDGVRGLSELLAKNGVDVPGALDSEAGVIEGWRRLVGHHGPCFVEKSPHHLHCYEALELIAAEAKGPTQCKVIGLIRNPVDALYSMWVRWGLDPERRQFDWLRAYRNLHRLEEEMPSGRLHLVRYEELVTKTEVQGGLAAFAGVKAEPFAWSVGSLGKWRHERHFGFQLDPSVARMAQSFGYEAEDLRVPRRTLWPAVRLGALTAQRFRKSVSRLVGSSQSSGADRAKSDS